MAVLTKRYSCLILQGVIFLYVIGSLVYVAHRHFNNPQGWNPSFGHRRPQIRIPYNPSYADQPSSYTIGPYHNPEQMVIQLPAPGNTTQRVKAGFVSLVRNNELIGMLSSMRDMEERFNKKYNYPWLFLNDEPFTDEFIARTSEITNAKTYYALVDSSMWSYPPHINQTLAAEGRKLLESLPYGDSESYRHMCRFQSGFFWRHPMLLELGWEYYWRVEPWVRFYCELDYDPFLYMKENNKQYAFTISFIEHGGTIPTLWSAVKEFVRLSHSKGNRYFSRPASDSLYRFITSPTAEEYNMCHFWTNFEIARVDLWHTQAYQDYFNFLDQLGGFFYERWGDAPVHSIFVALFLHKEQIHFFNDIGYRHAEYERCPDQENLLKRCYCNPAKSIDFADPMSCLNQYMDAQHSLPEEDQLTVSDIMLQT
ncbi:nucleotide-diphospho-sugar transferase [Radiomyces spectabilis]|uniref:nucleotide-diphospho-sugar transferase n=1 Tax=Radiomyces spectabilis TaxID=64574 RepID=UPI00222053F1|nr:nucleotide-diphospho-sugar transferase [Radiomyces spectabilis]KAI8374306.1 nucleotide-diphospho-sugar transferase [Radiomyces spectabilis]